MGKQLIYVWLLVIISVTVDAIGNCPSTAGKFPSSTAFLFLDFEVGVFAAVPSSTAKNTFITQSSNWLQAVRSSHRPQTQTMFSLVQFRPGYPDISCRNKQFVAIAASGGPIIGSAGTNFYSGFQPHGNEIQFEKRRVSAAYNSELLTLLDSQCIDTVVLAGLFTSGVILSTTRQLADADYTIYIVQDAVIDPNSTVNAVLLDSVLPAQAYVLTISDAINKL
jgi:nicotinamidase-related amidase